jgi:hypothetical protein
MRLVLLALCLLTACGEKEPPKPEKPLVTCEGFKDVPRDCISGDAVSEVK